MENEGELLYRFDSNETLWSFPQLAPGAKHGDRFACHVYQSAWRKQWMSAAFTVWCSIADVLDSKSNVKKKKVPLVS